MYSAPRLEPIAQTMKTPMIHGKQGRRLKVGKRFADQCFLSQTDRRVTISPLEGLYNGT